MKAYYYANFTVITIVMDLAQDTELNNKLLHSAVQMVSLK